MSKLIAMAFPVLQGKTEQLKKFTNELKTRYKKEYNESRKSLGVYERAFLQTSPNGDTVIVTFEGENPGEALKKLGEKTDEFTKWFNAQVKEIHGIDFSQKGTQPPLPELISETEPVEENVKV